MGEKLSKALVLAGFRPLGAREQFILKYVIKHITKYIDCKY